MNYERMKIQQKIIRAM